MNPVPDLQNIVPPVEEKQKEVKGKKKMPPKKFFMPEGVEAGFVKASRIGKKRAADSGGGDEDREVKKRGKFDETSDLAPYCAADSTAGLLTETQQKEFEKNYLNMYGDEEVVITMPRMDAFPERQRRLTRTKFVEHGRVTKAVVGMLNRMTEYEFDETRVEKLREAFREEDLLPDSDDEDDEDDDGEDGGEDEDEEEEEEKVRDRGVSVVSSVGRSGGGWIGGSIMERFVLGAGASGRGKLLQPSPPPPKQRFVPRTPVNKNKRRRTMDQTPIIDITSSLKPEEPMSGGSTPIPPSPPPREYSAVVVDTDEDEGEDFNMDMGSEGTSGTVGGDRNRGGSVVSSNGLSFMGEGSDGELPDPATLLGRLVDQVAEKSRTRAEDKVGKRPRTQTGGKRSRTHTSTKIPPKEKRPRKKRTRSKIAEEIEVEEL